MKKLKVLFLLASIFLLTSCSIFSPKYKEGVYEGVGNGYYKEYKPIRLALTIDKDQKIRDIVILDHGETEAVGQKALEELIKLSKQIDDLDSVKIDSISNATQTSQGFKQAFFDALEKAKNK